MLKFLKKGVSVSVVLDRRRIKINGMYPVKIQVIWHRKQTTSEKIFRVIHFSRRFSLHFYSDRGKLILSSSLNFARK